MLEAINVIILSLMALRDLFVVLFLLCLQMDEWMVVFIYVLTSLSGCEIMYLNNERKPLINTKTSLENLKWKQ